MCLVQTRSPPPPPAMTASETNGDAEQPSKHEEKPGEADVKVEPPSNSGNKDEHTEMQKEVKTERRTGSCKWFNVLKGFGFIVLDDTHEDVFVHQSELQMEGFRSLEEGERVAFYVRTRNSGQRAGALEAYQVGPEDASKTLIGSSIRPLGAKKDRMIRYHLCLAFSQAAFYQSFHCSSYSVFDTVELKTSLTVESNWRVLNKGYTPK
ncbi:cold-shock DNA-binding domain protein, partial [Oesophagostomum dentatum]